MKQKKFLTIFILMLLCSGLVRANAHTPVISGQAKTFTSSCHESAFVHTDRDLYVAGENLFFKLYVTSDKTANSSQVSSIGYIVLRNQKMNILNLIVKLKHGS